MLKRNCVVISKNTSIWAAGEWRGFMDVARTSQQQCHLSDRCSGTGQKLQQSATVNSAHQDVLLTCSRATIRKSPPPASENMVLGRHTPPALSQAGRCFRLHLACWNVPPTDVQTAALPMAAQGGCTVKSAQNSEAVCQMCCVHMSVAAYT